MFSGAGPLCEDARLICDSANLRVRPYGLKLMSLECTTIRHPTADWIIHMGNGIQFGFEPAVAMARIHVVKTTLILHASATQTFALFHAR